MAGLSYMQRRASGIYEFRKRLPVELAGRPAPDHLRTTYPELVNPKTGCFKGELVRSLGTTDYREAKRRDLREARKALDIFEAATKAFRQPPPPLSDIAAPGIATAETLEAIEAEALAEMLARDEEERTEGDDRRRLQTPEERAQWPDLEAVPPPWARGMSESHAFVYGIHIEEEARTYREAMSRHDPSIVRAETITAHRQHGIPIDPTSATFHSVGMAILKGTVRAYDDMLRRQRGEIVETPAPVVAPKAHRGPKLSEAFKLWQEGNPASGARRPGLSGILEAKPAVRWFTELHGDMHLGEITKGHAREFQRAMAKMPKRLPERLRRLPLPKLLERDLKGYEPRGVASINKAITMLAAIVSHAQRKGLLDAVPGYVNPFVKDMKLRVDKREEESREPFVPSDLQAIFGARVFRQSDRPLAGGGEAAYWFPLIALLSGMRLDEIAGLRIRDLCQDEMTERWVFDVNPRGGRSVKTASSIRKVPVHPELERIGLIQYRQWLVAQGHTEGSSLWPAVKSAAEGRPLSSPWSGWFGRLLREKVGITDRRKVFHSFRHTFKRMARDVGINEEIHDAITGHSGGSSVGKTYGRGVSLRPLIEAMDRIPVPDAVSGLAWSMPLKGKGTRVHRLPRPDVARRP